jgi:hypothetical protein
VATGWYSSYSREFPSTLEEPNEIAGFTKLDDPALRPITDRMTHGLGSAYSATHTVGGFYAPASDRAHPVSLIAGTTFLPTPQRALDKWLNGTSSDADLAPLANVHSVPSGSLGGTAKCGETSMTIAGTVQPVTVCAWTDHGSIGSAFFLNRSVEDSATKFILMREAVLHRR